MKELERIKKEGLTGANFNYIWSLLNDYDTPPEAIEKIFEISEGSEEHLRIPLERLIAMNMNTPHYIIERLASCERPEVRNCVVNSRNVSSEFLEKMLETEKEKSVRDSILSTIESYRRLGFEEMRAFSRKHHQEMREFVR